MSRVLALMFVLFASTTGLAQPWSLLGDDGFAVGCCVTPSPVLPVFPGVTIDGKHGCLLNCALEAEHLVDIQLGPPNFVTCDLAMIDISITPTSPGAPGYYGVIVAKYSRTWVEQTLTLPRQVWRFMINTDMIPVSFTYAAPCPLPLSAYATPALNLVHFWGSLDYALDFDPVTLSSSFSVRLDLNHLPGCIQHATWSARPLPAPFNQPNRSYHFVAPSSFTFVSVPVPQGTLFGEAARESAVGTVGYTCFGESRVTQGSLTTVNTECLCLPSIALGWANQTLSAANSCGTFSQTISTLPLPLTPIPTGMKALGLGVYAPQPGVPFPWQRELTIYFGVLVHKTTCAINFPYHIVTGVATSGQYGEVFGGVAPGVPMSRFLDFVNHKDITVPFTPFGVPPSFGSLSYGDLVWNFNML